MIRSGYSPVSEAKQVGILYRFQDIRSIKSLLSSDELIPTTNGAICLTRNKNHPSKRIRIGLVIDGDKLSNNYKIRPYSNANELPQYYEQEERVYRKITHFSQYILEAQIPRGLLKDELLIMSSGYSIMDELITDLKSHGIKVTIL